MDLVRRIFNVKRSRLVSFVNLTNGTHFVLQARAFIPGSGYGPLVPYLPSDHAATVKGPKRRIAVLDGDEHLPIEGDFLIDSESHDPAHGVLKVAPGEPCIHILPGGAILQVWLVNEVPQDVASA